MCNEDRQEGENTSIRLSIPLKIMKDGKRKHAEENDEAVEGSDVSESEGDSLSSTEPSASNAVPAPQEPFNLSIETLTQIDAAFTASTLVEQPLLEGKYTSIQL